MINNIYPVIVIGAGMSGIAASAVLCKIGIKHIILESRNRIGGRILSTNFNDERIQLGASFVHHPLQNNRIAELLEGLSWPRISAEFQKQQSFCEGIGHLSKQQINKGWEYHEKLCQSIKQQSQKSEVDISVTEATSKYRNTLQFKGQQKKVLDWVLNMYGCVEGAQTHQLSAKGYDFCESEDDYFPVGGYEAVLENIIKPYSPQIFLNMRVTEIDYNQSLIKLTLENGQIYQCEKLISSLPLGVLKQKLVKFTPQLPLKYQTAIDKIGNGIADKLFVSVEEPFWDKQMKWINFYTQKKTPYSIAMSIITEKQNLLCFFVSGEASKLLSGKQRNNLIQETNDFFTKFKIAKEVKVKDVYLTSWYKDVDSLGSYSFWKVGTEKKHFATLRESIDNKIWFVGEHCNEEENACVHSAYQTGIWAAEEISKIYHNQ